MTCVRAVKCDEEKCADPVHCLPKGTRFPDLRHFYASALIAANLNPKVIQARLGHASITETMDIYGNPRELHPTGELCPVPRLCRQSE
jgi:integrase